jgi:hypothetical protein
MGARGSACTAAVMGCLLRCIAFGPATQAQHGAVWHATRLRSRLGDYRAGATTCTIRMP